MSLKYRMARCGQDIEIQTRTQGFAEIGTTTPDQDFKTVLKTRAIVSVVSTIGVRGKKTIGGVSITNDVTHEFCIPFDTRFNFSQEHWIKFRGNRYDIDQVVNVGERDRVMVLHCRFRGPAPTSAKPDSAKIVLYGSVVPGSYRVVLSKTQIKASSTSGGILTIKADSVGRLGNRYAVTIGPPRGITITPIAPVDPNQRGVSNQKFSHGSEIQTAYLSAEISKSRGAAGQLVIMMADLTGSRTVKIGVHSTHLPPIICANAENAINALRSEVAATGTIATGDTMEDVARKIVATINGISDDNNKVTATNVGNTIVSNIDKKDDSDNPKSMMIELPTGMNQIPSSVFGGGTEATEGKGAAEA